MDFDIPTDLIDKAQIGFREAAGLSSFDRNDATLSFIYTVEESISSLDPSPSYLRCKFCNGKLLRGLQSLICIYCGEYQKKDLQPEPISFKSTHGYSWLLQSLNFNGSERIGSLFEGIGTNGEKSPAEDELTISELLDLKISLPDEPKNIKMNFSIKPSEHTSSLNLDTTDFDNFFTKSTSKSTTVSDVPEEQPVNKIVEDEENLTSNWNAEFQFADMKVENEKPDSVDPFKGAEAELSTHMDAVFGQTESLDFTEPDNDSDPFQDDLFANMSSATDHQNKQLDSVVQAKDDFSLQNAVGDWFSDVKNTNNPNDSSTDWFENTNWQKDNINNNNNTTTNKDDNLFDVKPHVNDLIQPEKSNLDSSVKQNPDVTDWFQESQWAIGGSSSTTNVVVNKNDDDDDRFGEWNDFTSSTGNQDSVKDSEKMPDLDLFQPTVDSKEVDFGNFFESDMFSGESTSIRNVEGSKNDEITPNATESRDYDVQMLMSQMHDLSFMLKNELSIPSKPDDNIGTSHS